MRMKIAIAVLVSLALPTSAFAGGWTQIDTVVKMVTSASGYTRIDLAGTAPNPDGCTAGAASNYFVESTHPEKETIVAIALSARASNQTLRFYVNGCYASGGVTYPKVWAVEY